MPFSRITALSQAAIEDAMDNLIDPPPPGVPLWRRWRRRRTPPQQTQAAYQSQYGLQIESIDPQTGAMQAAFTLYLPQTLTQHVEIRGDFTAQTWRPMTPEGDVEQTLWRYPAGQPIAPGMRYEFRYQTSPGQWRNVTDPLAYSYSKYFNEQTNQYDHYALTPDLAYDAQATPWQAGDISPGLAVCECTLAGLLTNWRQGEYFPDGPGHSVSLAERIRNSGLIERLREANYNAVMMPIQASVANHLVLDWKFSYLINGFGAVDQQFGQWWELKALIDDFHRAGILVIPDFIIVHHTRQTSPRSVDSQPETGKLWEDDLPNKTREYGTWMVNLADPQIRRHIVDVLARFVAELNLSAFRFDYVDGLLTQYEDHPPRQGMKNFGELFVYELIEQLGQTAESSANGGLPKSAPVCFSEAFDKFNHPAVQHLADVPYRPGVGFNALEQTLRYPIHNIGRVAHDVYWANSASEHQACGLKEFKPGLSYALSHDEAGRDEEGILKTRPHNAVGAHLAQLVLNFARDLPEDVRPTPEQTLDFVARRTMLIEAVTMFGSNGAYMTVGDFSDFLKLGCYDDQDGWQLAWSADQHPDLAKWRKATGLSNAEIQRQIESHAQRMRRLRGLFLEGSPLETQLVEQENGNTKTRLRPLTDVCCLCDDGGSDNPDEMNGGEAAVLTILQRAPNRRRVIALHFGFQDRSPHRIEAYHWALLDAVEESAWRAVQEEFSGGIDDYNAKKTAKSRELLLGEWEVVEDSSSADRVGQRLEATAKQPYLEIDLPAASLVILESEC